MSDYHRQALVLAQTGQWDQAHKLIQQYTDSLACQIHGYLHLQEDDSKNAHYWYTRAKEKLPTHSPQEEYKRLLELAKNF